MSQSQAHTPHDPEIEPEPDGHDEIVHVPKGKSPLAFILLVGLSLLMLVTFSVTPSMSGACAGRNSKDAVLRWQRPGHGTEGLSAPAFIDLKRKLSGWAKLNRQDTKNVSDREVVVTYLMDRLAEDAGILITDGELADFLRQIGFDSNTDNYKQLTSYYFGGVQSFESFIRMLVRVARYNELLARAASPVDPAGFEALWNKDHQELSIDYIELERDSFLAEAGTALPADAELEKWLADLPDGEKIAWKSQARAKAVIAGYRFAAGKDAKALLEKYPRAADADAEALAKAYYNSIFYMRFRRETPLPEDKEKGNTQEEFQRRFYKSFDEVAESVRAEAPLSEALGKWREDLAKRIDAGTAVDLKAEAEALGLETFTSDELRTQEEWTKLEDWGGNYFGWQLMEAEAGKLLGNVVTTDKALVVAQSLEKRSAELPPFAELREQVVARWIEKRASEVALTKLKALRANFLPATPTAEAAQANASAQAFADAAKAAGLAVGRRDGHDFNVAIDAADRSDLSLFLRTRRDLLASAAGDVLEPAANASGAKIYLLRLEAKRAKDLAKMTPSDLQALEQSAKSEQARVLRDNLFSLEGLMKTYSIENVKDALNLKQEAPVQGS
jgi:hypothetical protein